MIKNNMEKIIKDYKIAITHAIFDEEQRGGAPNLSYLWLFRNLFSTVSTTSLWAVIAMNKQYLTSLTCQCELLISPFDNRYLACNGVMKTVECDIGFA